MIHLILSIHPSLADLCDICDAQQERDQVAALKHEDAIRRRDEEHIKRLTAALLFKQKQVEVEYDRITRRDDDPYETEALLAANHDIKRSYEEDRHQLMRQNGRTADLLAASSSGDAITIVRLLREGVSVNVRNYDDRTPLHLASQFGHLETVDLLIEEGADVNAIDRYSVTPYEDALRNDHEHVVHYLRHRGMFSLLYPCALVTW
jgi:ankyrin repeat protein